MPARLLLALGAIVLASSIFAQNRPSIVNDAIFEHFQMDSEAFVIAKIATAVADVSSENGNLGVAVFEPSPHGTSFNFNEGLPRLAGFYPYVSSFGIQGWVFAKVVRIFHLPNVEPLHWFNAILLAITIVILSFQYSLFFGALFGALFYVSCVFSPWVVSYARNLYWVTFLWFLPAAIVNCAILYRSKQTRLGSGETLALGAFTAAVFVKCLAGYEFLSAIGIMAAAPVIFHAVHPSHLLTRPQALRLLGKTLALFLLGFICALVAHAYFRAGNVVDGLATIWNADVKRRTYGDPSLFPAIYQDSLTVGTVRVLGMYWNDWGLPFLFAWSGRVFRNLVLASIGVLALKCLFGVVSWRKEATLFVIFAAAPLSWYVLAKAHSYLHLHMNFVLWYFGFAAIVLFIPVRGAILLWAAVYGRPSTVDRVDSHAVDGP